MKPSLEMSLGDAVMAVLKGKVKRATRITEEENELIMDKNNAGNLQIKLRQAGAFEMLASPAVLHEDDAQGNWNVEYVEELQPFEILSVRYIKLQGETTKNKITHEYNTSLAEVKEEYEGRDDFRGFLSVVGFNGGKVTVLIGEAE